MSDAISMMFVEVLMAHPGRQTKAAKEKILGASSRGRILQCSKVQYQQYSAVQCQQCSAVQCNILCMSVSAVQCSAEQCSAVQYNAVQCSA